MKVGNVFQSQTTGLRTFGDMSLEVSSIMKVSTLVRLLKLTVTHIATEQTHKPLTLGHRI
jgi:hypothetical protein